MYQDKAIEMTTLDNSHRSPFILSIMLRFGTCCVMLAMEYMYYSKKMDQYFNTHQPHSEGTVCVKKQILSRYMIMKSV